MASPYSLRVSGRPGAYPHDAGEVKRLLSEAGWPQDRALRLAATTEVKNLSHHLADDFRNALAIEVNLTIIPDEDVMSAQKTLVEKNLPLPFDGLVHGWFDLVAG
jgi:hypothetical protein